MFDGQRALGTHGRGSLGSSHVVGVQGIAYHHWVALVVTLDQQRRCGVTQTVTSAGHTINYKVQIRHRR